MTELNGLDEIVCMQDGTPVNVVSGGKQVQLTRKLAIAQALESHKGAEDKKATYVLSRQFEIADGQISITHEEAIMIKSAIGEAWPQPGIYVPLCEWLEGDTKE